MFAPEFLHHADAFYGHQDFYPETAVLAYDMPLHANMEDHEFDAFHPLTDGLYHHNDLYFGEYAPYGLDHEAYWGHPDMDLMYLPAMAKIKAGAKRAGAAIKRGAQKTGAFLVKNKGPIK
jgi:hypothetical protein